MIQIPADLQYKVDEEYWCESFDPENPEHLKEKIINGYITCMLVGYRAGNRKNQRLWQIFHEDFEGFTYDIFKIAHRLALRDLREELVNKGVWVKTAKGATSYARVLQECLDEETPHKWTEAEIREQHQQLEHQPNQQPALRFAHQQLQTPQTNRTARTAQPLLNQPQWHRQRSYGTPDLQEPPLRQQHQPYEQFEIPDRGDGVEAPAKQLTDLMKIYLDDDKKYSGDEYDILDVKLQVFYDCCSKIGLPEDQYHSAYSIMLKGRASNFYYDKIAGRSYDFDTMVDMTKAHFETEENHQKYLSEWRETTLLRTITENPGKSRLECFQIMVDKLQKVQRGLSKDYQYEHNLRDQVINACRGVEECNLALYKPAGTFEGVCAELRSAIGTAIRSRQSASAFTAQTDTQVEDDEYDQYLDGPYVRRSRTRQRTRFWNL
jgi:hypothetical protein